MFLKPITKYNKTTGERHFIYRLCESYRIHGSIHHRIILGLGKLEELDSPDQKRMLAVRIEELIKNGSGTLALSLLDEKVEKLAQQFYQEIRSKRRCDFSAEKEDWEVVNLETLKNKDAREIGAEWLCQQAFDQLGISEFLRQENWDEEKISLATTHIISRAVYPASELKTVSVVRENSAI